MNSKTLASEFDYDELLCLLEIAKIVLDDGNLYEWVANQMDISDEFLRPLWKKLGRRMDKEAV